MSKSILITGATGKQGGAVLRSLLAHPSFSPSSYTIYAVTRDPASASAKRLRSQSPAIRLVEGGLNNAPELFKSLPSSPWGVYLVTMPGKANSEEVEGKAFVDESVKAGVKHLVFSSVERGSANGGFNPTDVPHFATKHKVEAHLMEAANKSQAKLTYTILRPVFFLDNLEWGFMGKIISTAWRDHVKRPLQVVDTVDIGTLGANAFLEAESPTYKNRAISVAGDELTYEQADKVFMEKTGQAIPTTYGFIASLVLWLSHDVSSMFKFFNDPGYTADISYVRNLSRPKNFSEWVDRSKFAKKTA
ncbi:MAG: hypothetical protein LQ340_003940 [Diploschistes diacapsis]|nr:MAG: hypothetical protein LQ340_003940 [Diploschistes diacapsis]